MRSTSMTTWVTMGLVTMSPTVWGKGWQGSGGQDWVRGQDQGQAGGAVLTPPPLCPPFSPRGATGATECPIRCLWGPEG